MFGQFLAKLFKVWCDEVELLFRYKYSSVYRKNYTNDE